MVQSSLKLSARSAVEVDEPGSMTKQFLVVDPLHEYALRFIRVVTERFGYQPLCVYTDRALQRTAAREYPPLRATESIVVPASGLEQLGRRLRDERDIAGVIPFNDVALPSSIAILLGLGSTWNDASVLALLRDKFAMKEHLRRVQPQLEVGASRRFFPDASGFSFADVPERFVLKPNAGYGNRSVGFFTHRTPVETIEEFIRSSGVTEFVLEEFFPGDEYFVNGQLDEQGACMVIAVFRYERVWANGRHVDWLTHKVSRTDPAFPILERYARAVLTGVGLRRSPFHLEVKLENGVPRLVELGSRLAGNGNAPVCNRLHGDAFDVFLLAADHYLHDRPQTVPRLDWDSYDSKDVLYVHGVSFERQLVYEIDAKKEIEQERFFAGWVRAPRRAERTAKTVDLFSAPWTLLLEGPAGSHPSLIELAERARLLLLPRRPKSLLRKASVLLENLHGRIRRKVHQVLLRLLLR
jgi:hypothetical protein